MNIKEELKKVGKTQSQLASDLGVKKQQVHKWTTGKISKVYINILTEYFKKLQS